METNGDERVVRSDVEVDVAPASANDAIARESRRRKSPGWLILIGAVMVLCLLGRTVGALYSGFVTNATELAETLDQFMRMMAEGDTRAASGLFEADAESERTLEGLQELQSGANRVLFDGYQSIQLSDVNMNWSTDAGLVATIEAAVSYEGGYSGTLEAVLVSRAGRWWISGIDLTVPPAKLDRYRTKIQ